MKHVQSRLTQVTELNCSEAARVSFSVGDQVVVDGLQGRGIIVKVYGKCVDVRFRNNLLVTRQSIFVHKI